MPTPQLSARSFTLPGLRWWIIVLLFLVTLINFLDRLTISVLATPICDSLHLNNQQFAQINLWFLAAYTISHGVSGRIYDVVGVKRGLAGSIGLWSAAAMAHALAGGIASFSFFRALLGLGEAGNWPAAANVIAEWFPIRQRSLANGIMNWGTSLGSVIAPPLIVWLNLKYGWPATFLVTGILGFGFLALWLSFYYPMATHPLLSEEERTLIESNQPAHLTHSAPRPRWRDLLKFPQVWAIVLSRLLVDPIWWLYILWLPKYLGSERHLSLEQAGWGTSVPFLAASLGCYAGGAGAGFLMRRGYSVQAARKTVIFLAACLMPAGVLVPYAQSVGAALTWISVVTFGFQTWMNNVQTLPSDLFPKNTVASVAGLGGFGAGIGSMIFTLTTGWVVDHFSYTPIIITAGLLAPIGTVILFSLLSETKPLQSGYSHETSTLVIE